MRLRSPQTELDQLHERSVYGLSHAMFLVQRARIQGQDDLADRRLEDLGKSMGRMLAAADLLGRRRLLLELRARGLSLPVDEGPTGAQFAAVPFLEAISDILSREPVLAIGWQATREAWADKGFALARSTSVKVTERVQASVTRFLRQGTATTIEEALREIMSTEDFTHAYAETVFRTTTASAYQSGRAAQMQRPAVKRAACGWRYTATLDADVRVNHRSGEDFIAHVDDPVWQVVSPPNGYQCRCATEIVPTGEMVGLGLAYEDGSLRKLTQTPPGFHPDPGF